MAMKLKHIDRQNVVDSLLHQLLEQMISGQVRPGDKLPPESEMAAELGAGRNSVREALKVLQTLGVFDRRQGDGTYVASTYQMPFDWVLFPLLSRIEKSQDLVELRLVVELGITELVIEKVCLEDLQEIEKRQAEFEQICQNRPFDADATVEADVNFHVTLAEIARNDALLELSRLIMRLFAPSMKTHLSSSDGATRATHDHRDFLENLKIRDRDQARRVVIRSFEHWRQYIEPAQS